MPTPTRFALGRTCQHESRVHVLGLAWPLGCMLEACTVAVPYHAGPGIATYMGHCDRTRACSTACRQESERRGWQWCMYLEYLGRQAGTGARSQTWQSCTFVP